MPEQTPPAQSGDPAQPLIVKPNQRNFRRRLALYILLPLLGLFLVAAIGGKLFLAPSESRPLAILPQPTETVTPTQQPASSQSKWQKYVDKKQQISFEYPVPWTIRDRSNVTYKIKPQLNPLLDVQITDNMLAGSLYVIDNPNTLSLDDLNQEVKKEAKSDLVPAIFLATDEEYISPAGVAMYVRKDASCEPVVCDIIIIPAGNKVYMIMHFKEKTADQAVLFQHIVDTFVFTKGVALESEEVRLVSVSTQGGLCPDGVCKSEVVITAKGEVVKNKSKQGKLTDAELRKLDELVLENCCSSLRTKKFTGTCPTAYDGQETIYRFYMFGIIEEVKSCEYVIDEKNVLIAYVHTLLDKYTK